MPETSRQYILISENRDQIRTMGDNIDHTALERGILNPKLTIQGMKKKLAMIPVLVVGRV